MAGRPKRRARMKKMHAGHGRVRTHGTHRCTKCGRPHSFSEHWSHKLGGREGAGGEVAHYDRVERPQRLHSKRRKTKAHGFAEGAALVKSGKLKRSRKASKAHAKAAVAAHRAHKKGHSHHVRGHLAHTPGTSHSHRVKGHNAKNPTHHKKGRKGARKGHRKGR